MESTTTLRNASLGASSSPGNPGEHQECEDESAGTVWPFGRTAPATARVPGVSVRIVAAGIIGHTGHADPEARGALVAKRARRFGARAERNADAPIAIFRQVAGEPTATAVRARVAEHATRVGLRSAAVW